MKTDTTEYIEVLGVKVRKRTEVCNPDNVLTTGFNLVVHVTDACPGRCAFCCNKSTGFSLDVEMFKRDFEKIRKQCQIDRVFFTGGEPMLYWEKIKECLTVIDAPTTIHTMGINLEKLDAPVEISLSRHHWDHVINERILGVNLPLDYVSSFPHRTRLHLACNIIKGHVDNPTDMIGVLDFALDNELPLVGFIGLMPINDYSKEFGVPVPDLSNEDVLRYRTYAFGSACHCANYLYHRDGRFQQYYVRHNLCPSANRGGRLVYKNGIQPWYNQ